MVDKIRIQKPLESHDTIVVENMLIQPLLSIVSAVFLCLAMFAQQTLTALLVMAAFLSVCLSRKHKPTQKSERSQRVAA